MRRRTMAMLAIGGSLALAGAAAAAEHEHILKVALPDGSIEQIRYTGDVAPHVVLAPAAADDVADDPFMQMQLMAAAMDRQMAAMMQQAATAPQPMAAPGMTPGMTMVSTGAGQAPAGYSFRSVSTTTVNGCTQTVETTSTGDNQPAKVVKTSAGDCKPDAAPAVTAPKPSAKRAAPADTI